MAHDPYDVTALHVAGTAAMAQFLVENGADLNDLTVDEWSPLQLAAEDGRLEVVRWLLEQGAAMEHESGEGLTPLHFAIQSKPVRDGHWELLSLLLSHGANINAVSIYDTTPLDYVHSRHNPMRCANALEGWLRRQGALTGEEMTGIPREW